MGYKIILTILLFISLTSATGDKVSSFVTIHSPFGLPQNYQNVTDFYIVRKQYIVCYNEKLKATNFVCYNLNKNWFGNSSRYSGSFLSDNSINEKLGIDIRHSDYTNSGYDRGHLVKSKERSCSDSDNKSTFYLSNILPQTPDLNTGPWLRLEEYCEQLALDENKNLYIIAGGIFTSKNILLNNKITVPDTLFKIVLITDFNNKTKKSINIVNTRVIAVKIPNVRLIRKHKWEVYSCSVRDVEESIRYDVFNLLDNKTEKFLETLKCIK